MEGDWGRFAAAASRRHQSRYDEYLGFEEMDAGGEEDSRVEYPCPFCYEVFDIVGMCLHVDEEHPVEAQNGICPVCQIWFGTELVAHVTMEHGNFLKMQRRKRSRKGSSGTQSAISFFRKDLREGTLQSLMGGSSYTVAPSSSAADPLLSSFINLPMDSSKDVQPELLDEVIIENKISDEKIAESLLIYDSVLQKGRTNTSWKFQH